MRCPKCGTECRTNSESEVLRFICRCRKCQSYGHVMGEKTGDTVRRTDYPEKNPEGGE